MLAFTRRSAIAAMCALAVSACVTVNERSVPFAEVSGWKVAEVMVQYAPDAAVNLDNKVGLIAQKQLGSEGVAAAPVDPANPGRNLLHEKVMEIGSKPEVIAAVRTEAANEVSQTFRRAFATQPSGGKPVRLLLDIVAIQDMGDQALLNVKASFVDIKSGQVLLQNPTVGHLRPSRRAQAVGAFIGGGLAGVAGVVIGAAIMDGGRPAPFQDVQEETALKLKTWLLKPDVAR